MYGALFGAMTAAMNAKGNSVKQEQANELAFKRTRESELNAQMAQMSNINLQNAYNSPAAQMQRLRDAGLNPMLAFQNGVSGNLSTGIGNMLSPSPAPNDISPMSIDAGVLASIDDYNLKKKELDLKATSQEFEDNLKKEQTEETKAKRKILLKDLSFKDTIEQDRHNESLMSQKKLNSDVIYQGAQTSLALQQKERLIEQAIEAKNQLFENKRQFDIQMQYYKEHDASEKDKHFLQIMHESEQNALQRLADKAINDASNSMWYKVTMSNNDYSKWRFYLDHGGTYREASTLRGMEGFFSNSTLGGRLKNAAADGVRGMARNTREKVNKFRERMTNKKYRKEFDAKMDKLNQEMEQAANSGDAAWMESVNRRIDQVMNDAKTKAFGK